MVKPGTVVGLTSNYDFTVTLISYTRGDSKIKTIEEIGEFK